MSNAGNLSGTWTGTEAGVVTTNQVKVKAIIYYVAVADDTVVIKDGSNTNDIMTLTNHTATSNVVVPLDGKVFPDGLYISSITAGSKIYIIPEESII